MADIVTVVPPMATLFSVEQKTKISIPPEIWMQIAGQLSNAEQSTLFALNRYFFEQGMNARYREIELPGKDGNLAKVLCRLKDSSVAARVQSLRIYTYSLHLFYEERTSKSLSKASKFSPNIKQFLHSSSSRSNSGTEVDEPIRWHKNMFGEDSFWQLMQIMSSIHPHLPNVDEVHITWGWLPILFDAPTFFLKTCFAKSYRLRVLSLVAQIRKLKALLPLTGSFDVLEELNLSIAAEQAGTEEMPFAGSLTADVVPFINRLTPTLKALGLKCYARADFSAFFSALECFPVLRRFRLTIAFDNLLSNGHSIITFISNHSSSLDHLSIEPLEIWPYHTSPIRQWILRRGAFAFAVKVEKLRELALDLRSCGNMFRFQTLVHALTSDVAPFVTTLTSLTIENFFFKEEDAMLILEPFEGRRLKHLSLFLASFSPQLVDFLANTLLGLKALKLRCKQLTPYLGVRSWDLTSSAQNFYTELGGRVYDHWRLRTVHLAMLHTAEQETDPTLMCAFRKCIPSLTYQ